MDHFRDTWSDRGGRRVVDSPVDRPWHPRAISFLRYLWPVPEYWPTSVSPGEVTGNTETQNVSPSFNRNVPRFTGVLLLLHYLLLTSWTKTSIFELSEKEKEKRLNILLRTVKILDLVTPYPFCSKCKECRIFPATSPHIRKGPQTVGSIGSSWYSSLFLLWSRKHNSLFSKTQFPVSPISVLKSTVVPLPVSWLRLC